MIAWGATWKTTSTVNNTKLETRYDKGGDCFKQTSIGYTIFSDDAIVEYSDLKDIAVQITTYGDIDTNDNFLDNWNKASIFTKTEISPEKNGIQTFNNTYCDM